MLLNIETLREFVVDLKGELSEPQRNLIAKKLVDVISNLLRTEEPQSYQEWVSNGYLKFLRQCDLTDPDQWLPSELKIEPHFIRTWADQWLEKDTFRVRNNGKNKQITPEMNGLRVTMIGDLLKRVKHLTP